MRLVRHIACVNLLQNMSVIVCLFRPSGEHLAEILARGLELTGAEYTDCGRHDYQGYPLLYLTYKAGDKPGTESQAGDMPGTEAQAGDKPGTEAQAGDKPGTEAQAGDKPGTEAQAEDKPGTEAQAGDKPGTEAQAGDKPGTEAQAGDKPGTEAQAGDKPGTEAQAGDRPGTEAQAGDKPGTEAQAGDMPGTEAQAGDKPGTEGDKPVTEASLSSLFCLLRYPHHSPAPLHGSLHQHRWYVWHTYGGGILSESGSCFLFTDTKGLSHSQTAG